MAIFCKLTGDFSIQFNGKRADFFKKSSYKAMQLLAILMYYYDEGVYRAALIEYLYGNNVDVDASNSLKALIFRLRKQLNDSDLLANEQIIYEDGVYRFNSSIPFDSDIKQFFDNYNKAKEVGEKERITFLEKAVRAISGPFLPMFSSEHWTIVERNNLESKYCDAIRKLSACYKKEVALTKVKDLYFRAKAMFPYEDEWELGYLGCLVKEGRIEDAHQEYEHYKKVLAEDQASYPSELLQHYYQSILNKRFFNQENANEVFKELLATRPEGAYRCSFANFADNYHLLNRIMLREHIESTFLLCGIVDNNDKFVSDYHIINTHIEYLERALVNCLRKSDIITRYGMSQLLVLLWNTNEEKAKQAIIRIDEAYKLQSSNDEYKVKCFLIDSQKIDTL